MALHPEQPPRMKLEGLNILITSNEPWGDVWFSKHHYANELTKHNQVVFVNPTAPWRPGMIGGVGVSLQRVQQNLHVLNYRNLLPAFHDLPFSLNNAFVSRAIRNALHTKNLVPDIYIAFDPSRLYNPKLLGAKRSVFFAVDDYAMTIRGERFIFPNVDRFITLSESFNRTYAPYNKPILTISHAIAAEAFQAEPARFGVTEYGLYIGTMDHRLDLDLIRSLVTDQPRTPFVFVGPYALEGNQAANELFRQGKYPNVHLVGTVPSRNLAAYIAGARFCLAPMDIKLHGNSTSHHKIFQYLALGKPVFSTTFTEYAPIAQLLYMSNDEATTRARLGRFLAAGEPEDLPTDRIAFARTKTYDALLVEIGDFLDVRA